MNFRSYLSILVLPLLAIPAFAQDEKPAPRREPSRAVRSSENQPSKQAPKPSPVPGLSDSGGVTQATVEMVINEAVKNIGKRYNLNEAQLQKTDEIMKRDVHKFLKDHEESIWPIIRELMSNGFQPPSDPEAVKRIGKAAEPLIRPAQEAILKGNEEWRQYLTPQQKVMHDFDLDEMQKQFVEVEQNFRSWAEGKPRGNLFPSPAMDKSPPTPTKPGPGLPQPPPPPEPQIELFAISLFDTYVEDFIKQYELTAAQIDAARSILTEFRQKAADFKESNKAEMEKIARAQKAAMEDKEREKIAQAEADRKKFLEPVYDLFNQMDERLKALLTSAQLERSGTRQTNAAGAKDPLGLSSPPARTDSPPTDRKDTPPPKAEPATPPSPAP